MRSLGNMFISDVNVDRLAPDHQLVWEGIMNINNNKQSHTSNIGMSIVTGVVIFMALYALISVFEFQPVTNFFLAGMDVMARALESAAKLLEESPYKKMLADRYASFDSGKGKEFEDGKLTLEDLVAYTKANGEPKQTSGKQELYEAIVNMYC
jgi:hypothetical protein